MKPNNGDLIKVEMSSLTSAYGVFIYDMTDVEADGGNIPKLILRPVDEKYVKENPPVKHFRRRDEVWFTKQPKAYATKVYDAD